MLRTPALLYASGSLAAFAVASLLVVAGHAGLHHAVGVALKPHWGLAYLYPKLVWGGIAAWLFLLPIPFRYSIFGAAFLSVIPTLFLLLVVLPTWEGAGYFGLSYGYAMPFFVFGYTLLYMVLTSIAMRLTGGR